MLEKKIATIIRDFSKGAKDTFEDEVYEKGCIGFDWMDALEDLLHQEGIKRYDWELVKVEAIKQLKEEFKNFKLYIGSHQYMIAKNGEIITIINQMVILPKDK